VISGSVISWRLVGGFFAAAESQEITSAGLKYSFPLKFSAVKQPSATALTSTISGTLNNAAAVGASASAGTSSHPRGGLIINRIPEFGFEYPILSPSGKNRRYRFHVL